MKTNLQSSGTFETNESGNPVIALIAAISIMSIILFFAA